MVGASQEMDSKVYPRYPSLLRSLGIYFIQRPHTDAGLVTVKAGEAIGILVM